VEGSILHIHDPVRSNEKLVSELTKLVENAYVVVSHQSVPGDDELSTSEGSESEASESECRTTESEKEDDVLGALDAYTTSLMDLRPVLEQSLNDLSQPFAKRAGVLPTKFQVTESARPYVLQVHDKYREAESALVERLGEANWQRYVRIKAMMAAAMTREYPELVVPENVISEIPKSTFQPVSLFHDSGLGTSMPSRSQYAASNASHTSFLSTETDIAKGRLRVPKTPVEVGEGIAFTCFICAQRLSGIRNRVDWKIHVFTDLHPYICTFPDCPDLLSTYPTRKLWAEHEFATHRSHQQYECHDCSRTFSEESEFIDHISDDHQYKELNHTQLLATISAAKKSVLKPLSDQACPLCYKKSWTLQRDFVTHLGRHLEEIALSSLPRDAGSESDSNSGSDTDDTNAVSRPYFEAHKFETSWGVIKPGPVLNRTQEELQRMIREFTLSANSLKSYDKTVSDLLSLRNERSKYKWDFEAARLEKGWKTYIVIIFKREMTYEELRKHQEREEAEAREKAEERAWAQERARAQDRAQGELARAHEELARAHEELARAQEELARAQEEPARTQEELARAQEELARAQEELAMAQEERERTQEELARTQEERERAQEERVRAQEPAETETGVIATPAAIHGSNSWAEEVTEFTEAEELVRAQEERASRSDTSSGSEW
jgi:hypothetical protein